MLVGKPFTLSNTDQVYGNAYVVIIVSRITFIHGGQPKSDQWLSATRRTTYLSHLIVNAAGLILLSKPTDFLKQNVGK